jgi:uncharacterized protein (TIGR02646 family)
MFKKFLDRPRNGKREKREIKFLRPFKGGDWDSKDPRVKRFKKKINVILRGLQRNYCAYCGLKLDETSAPELEHIAPKRPNHVELAFTPFNLCLACSFCNGFSKKGTDETVSAKNINYSKYSFNIVHPHFDDPAQHFEWAVKGPQILIQHRSIKGQKSIAKFGLALEAMTEARTKQYIFEKMAEAGLVEKVLAYFPI